ncbi:MAG: YqjF family protein [Phycisphaeraceae bacterium]
MDRLPAATDHRPWPMPRGRWAMRMTWHELLFAHWPVRWEALQPVVPGALAIDTFDGSAWVGVIPLGMRGVRPRGWPAALGWAFLELNVRTYVTVGGKPGVYFFSLDAANRLAVRAARWSWNLAYFDAAVSLHHDDEGWINYASERTHRGAPAARLAARYRPVGGAQRAAAGSFEQFAMERYCLYTVNRRGHVHRGEIHHGPWMLRPAEARFDVLEMTEQVGVALPETLPRLHHADAMDVVAWLPERQG